MPHYSKKNYRVKILQSADAQEPKSVIKRDTLSRFLTQNALELD